MLETAITTLANSKGIRCTEMILSKIHKYSPQILTGLGITGVFSTAISTAVSTVKSCNICQEFEPETIQEKIQLCWKYYIPPVIMGIVSAACIFGANTVSSKREAALLSLYSIADSTLKEYKKQITNELGESKANEIEAAVNKKYIDAAPPSSEVIITGKHDVTLCYETLSGRYFRSSISDIKRAENDLNRKTIDSMWCTMNDYYDALGLDCTNIGEDMGWTYSNPIDIHYSAIISPDDEPAIVLDHMNLPKPLW